MLILHLSDLHFGAHSRFKGEDLAKLGKAFFKDLNATRGSFAKGSRIDLVAVTGDIAESGKPKEFEEGERFLWAGVPICTTSRIFNSPWRPSTLAK